MQKVFLPLALGGFLFVLATAILTIAFEKQYAGKIYPNVTIDGIAVGGKTAKEVETYWDKKNLRFDTAQFELTFEGEVATISGIDIDLGYDATLSATQAYSVGRSPQLLSNFYTKFVKRRVELPPYYRWNEEPINQALEQLAAHIDIPVQDALFQFENGRVTTFKASHNGRAVNKEEAKKRLAQAFASVAKTKKDRYVVSLPVDTIKPSVTTDQVNSFGIKERIGRGYSEYQGSIPGRIHNVALGASRVNGILIKPGETFSFNDAVGDISAATGYQSAYIIKNGRTVLGDGGGICQVSSTLFRAAMDAGLPIVERHAHAYRVHYYEEGGFPPGIDATVFSPTVDLKFKNDTPGSILIQAIVDSQNLALTFEFYGTSDGRKAEILNTKLWNVTSPPPDLYQDDPTLPVGAVKQVDFSAWGANASFQYKVTRDGKVLQDTTFTSIYRPWQAVYLRGTGAL